MTIRPMRDEERDQVARLIHRSTNQWYQENRGFDIFPAGEALACRLFTDVYEDLDPGCCLVAEHPDGWLAGSCFYHPRENHVSLGIMNVHPDAFGLGVAGSLLTEILSRAGTLPVRLISSAMNLDSYSLYTRAGFRPSTLYQDMQFPTQPDVSSVAKHPGTIRQATLDDASTMADLELKLSGIRREKDYRYFIKNLEGIWRTLVLEEDGKITGFLSSVHHPASQMLGPGVCSDWRGALALIMAHHTEKTDSQPVFLVPSCESRLTDQLYKLGARNLELHLTQVHGDCPRSATGSVILPSFMPETG